MSRRAQTVAVDADVRSLLDVLAAYKKAHPKAEAAVQRQNAVSLRILVVDPDFKGMDRLDRHNAIWTFLERAPEDAQSQITFVLGLTPKEMKTSFVNIEFADPVPSHL